MLKTFLFFYLWINLSSISLSFVILNLYPIVLLQKLWNILSLFLSLSLSLYIYIYIYSGVLYIYIYIYIYIHAKMFSKKWNIKEILLVVLLFGIPLPTKKYPWLGSWSLYRLEINFHSNQWQLIRKIKNKMSSFLNNSLTNRHRGLIFY